MKGGWEGADEIESSLAELWDDGGLPVLAVRLGLGREEPRDVFLGDNLRKGSILDIVALFQQPRFKRFSDKKGRAEVSQTGRIFI